LPTPTTLPTTFQFAGYTFAIDAYQQEGQVSDFIFNEPIILTIIYSDANIAGLDESTLMLYYFDPETVTWQVDGITVIERVPAENRLVLALSHLTEFALVTVDDTLAEATEKVYLPIVTRHHWKIKHTNGTISTGNCKQILCVAE